VLLLGGEGVAVAAQVVVEARRRQQRALERGPGEVGRLSTPKVARSWQELQLMLPSFDNRASK
jgi:hypothetical protein